jgi:hypothetical protein
MQNAYRSLELLCRNQAALSAHEETKKVLEQMACEYHLLAEDEERQRSLNQNTMRNRIPIDETHSRAIIREVGKRLRALLRLEPGLPVTLKMQIDRLRELQDQ